MWSIRGMIILLAFSVVGEVISKLLPFAMPSGVIGMLLLLCFLMLKWIKLEQVQGVSEVLLSHLGLLFIPAGVGLITAFDLIQKTWPIIILICVISTWWVLVITGLCTQAAMNHSGRKKHAN